MNLKKIRIILVDDHNIVRSGLKNLLENEEGMVIVGEVGTGIRAISLCRELQPDIVIMDVAMPDMNGMEATRKIMARMPNTKVLALSMHSDRRFVSHMFDAGASGYMLKDCALEELAYAIRSIMSSKVYISPSIGGIIVDNYMNRQKDVGTKTTFLTHREKEVLQLISEGKTTKKAAEMLCLSSKTIDSHRKNIMDKLDIHTVAELTKYALREGMTSLDI